MNKTFFISKTVCRQYKKNFLLIPVLKCYSKSSNHNLVSSDCKRTFCLEKSTLTLNFEKYPSDFRPDLLHKQLLDGQKISNMDLYNILMYFTDQNNNSIVEQIVNQINKIYLKTDLVVMAHKIITILCESSINWKLSYIFAEKANEMIQFQSLFTKIAIAASRFGNLEEILHSLKIIHHYKLLPPEEMIFFFAQNPTITDKTSSFIPIIERYATYSWHFPNSLPKHINTFFPEEYWNIKKGIKILKNYCTVCSTSFPHHTFSKSHCELLKVSFYDHVLTNERDPVTKTKEFESDLSSSKKFISVHLKEPFDCVIDWQNLYYTLFNQGGSKLEIFAYLSKAILKLHQDYGFHKFCLVGKRIKTVSEANIRDTLKNISDRFSIKVLIFNTHNICNDDAFMIYMTLAFGPKTYILSRDHFGTHKHLLPSSDYNLFCNWQSLNQISTGIHTKTDKFYYERPLNLEIKPHCSEASIWHLPYVDSFPSKSSLKAYFPPYNWLCIQKNT